MNSGPQNEGTGGSNMKWEKSDKKFSVGIFRSPDEKVDTKTYENLSHYIPGRRLHATHLARNQSQNSN